MGSASLVEGGPGAAEARPQLGLHRLVQFGATALVGLPLLEDRPQFLAAALPLDASRILGSDGLRTGDERLPLGQCGRLGRSPGRGLLLTAGLHSRRDAVEFGLERVEVTDEGRLGHLLGQVRQLLGGIAGRQFTGGVQPLFEQVGHPEQLVVFAGEILQRLVRTGTGIGPDRLLLLTAHHIDGSVLADAPEPGRLGGVGCRRRHRRASGSDPGRQRGRARGGRLGGRRRRC